MQKIMTWENLDNFVYTNHAVLEGDIQGILLEFIGLGGANTHFAAQITDGIMWGQKGVLYVKPYNNPWNWMNRQAIDYTDEILDVLFDHFNLPESTPIISAGGSMGGQSALMYTKYAKRTPKACFAMVPVCDMVYHFTERKDLPRTLYSAFYNEEGTMEDALRRYSPLHLASEMPDVPYYIFHGTMDKKVNIDAHSEKLVAALQPSHSVTYVKYRGYDHSQVPHDIWVKWNSFIEAELGL